VIPEGTVVPPARESPWLWSI